MATIYINDTKPFPNFLAKSDNKRETFANYCNRQKAKLKLISDQMELEKKDQENLRELRASRNKRKYSLFYESLDLILRHRDEICATARYANIDAHYLIRGGGLYVGPLATARQFNFSGTLVNINLKLSTLLEIWNSEQFQIKCKCGDTAVISSFSGSPLSGSSRATAICPNCKKESSIGNRSFGKYYSLMLKNIGNDIEKVAKNIIAKWSLAELTYDKKVNEGNASKWSGIGYELYGDGEICDLETMINELKMKEFEAQSRAEEK